jgi:hypothetical protein
MLKAFVIRVRVMLSSMSSAAAGKSFFFLDQLLCASRYRTPCSTSGMDIYSIFNQVRKLTENGCTVVASTEIARQITDSQSAGFTYGGSSRLGSPCVALALEFWCAHMRLLRRYKWSGRASVRFVSCGVEVGILVEAFKFFVCLWHWGGRFVQFVDRVAGRAGKSCQCQPAETCSLRRVRRHTLNDGPIRHCLYPSNKDIA